MLGPPPSRLDHELRLERLADEVEAEMETFGSMGYGAEDLAMAAAYVCGRHRLDPTEYLTVLEDLYFQRASLRAERQAAASVAHTHPSYLEEP